jgi:hypothetical protein
MQMGWIGYKYSRCTIDPLYLTIGFESNSRMPRGSLPEHDPRLDPKTLIQPSFPRLMLFATEEIIGYGPDIHTHNTQCNAMYLPRHGHGLL